MKFAFVMILVLGSAIAIAKDVKNFNETLINDVKNDIETDNDQTLKSETSRAPASVIEEGEPVIEEDLKVNKRDKQIGNQNKW